tara:strand:- start:560 stop:736 length:177 start_codon:yes stop_codon:yes gene_type:complete
MQTPIYPNTLDINQILDDLNSKFPDVMPDLNLSEKEYGYRVGQVSVVRYLKHKLLDEE